MSERMKKLEGMLEKQPNDTFLLYGLAQEYKKVGDQGKAIALLDRVIALDAGYCYAYFQKGQVLEDQGKVEEAKTAYRAGVEAARKKGDAHAESELSGALAMIE